MHDRGMVPLSYRFLLRFWSPLALTWFFMALEGPVISSLIARMPEPKYNLAAYGVAYAFALIFEAPVIMLMTAASTLVRGRLSYERLLRFTCALCLSVLSFNLVILSPPVFQAVVGLLALPPAVEQLTYQALLVLLPWPIAIGFRRFLQGVMVGQGQTKKIALGTTVRLATMLSAALAGMLGFTALPGAAVGAFALSAGVVAEAVVVFLMARPYIACLPTQVLALAATPQQPALGLTYRGIGHFYLPLALTSFMALAVQPMVTFFVGLCRLPLESLAVMPVINAFLFIFKSIGLSYQEMAVALNTASYEGQMKLRNFALIMAAVFSVAISVIALTPLAQFWFEDVSGLSRQMAQFALWPLRLLMPVPALTVMLCWLRSLAITRRKTGLVSAGTVLEVSFIAVVMGYAAYTGSLHGASAAALAVTLGRCACCAFYWIRREQLMPSVNENLTTKLSTRST